MTQSKPPDVQDTGFVRPLVAGRVSDRGIWVFAAILAVVAVALFSGLETRRVATDISIRKSPVDQGDTIITPAAQLVIPPAQPDYSSPPVDFVASRPAKDDRYPSFRADRGPSWRSPEPYNVADTRLNPSHRIAYDNPFTTGVGAVPASLYAAAASTPVNSTPAGGAGAALRGPSERVEASRFANPATTVPKGTVIQAVLESALDSTRAGLARAIISRDVYSFDGSHVLIQKGSRLVGEYKADLAIGQSRALIQWQRLIRPDGVVINLDSPSADPLGRAGVEGKVNSHFFARFGGAILQSALSVGTQVAASDLSSGATILAIPGSFPGQGSTSGSGLVGQEKVQPTLTVKQGTSVSVFVARDLDFTGVE